MSAVLVPVACTNEVVVFEPEDDGSETASSSTGPGTGGAGAGTSSGGSGPGPGTGVGGSGSSGPTVVTAVGPSSSSTGGGETVTCFPPINNGCPTLANAPATYGYCTWQGDNQIIEWLDGPLPNGTNECCYAVVLSEDVCVTKGRPFLHDRASLLAPARYGDDGWCAKQSGHGGELSREERAVLAAAWEEDALAEHASVASFARVALELMSAGAPAHLVEATQRASLDEIVHARLCFALAARYRGEAVGPGAFPLGPSLALRSDLGEIAAAAVIEGCVGETLSAAVAQAQLDATTDPQVQRALAVIAADEARHAELAWSTVAWAVRTGGEAVRQRVARAFHEALRPELLSASAASAACPAHGRLDEPTLRDVRRRTLREVVLPCQRALLQQSAESSRERAIL